MTKAYAYLRVSGKGQEDGDGYDRQLTTITKYAKTHGIQIIGDAYKEIVTGKTEKRERWAEMLTAILSDGVRTILIEKLDRLARDLMVQEHIIADLKSHGITLISAMEPDLCIDDPSRKLLRQIMGAIAEYDREMIVAKLRAARERVKAKTGRCEGRKPFGMLPGEAPALARMRALRKTLTLMKVVDALNADHVPTRHGGQWTYRTVQNILAR